MSVNNIAITLQGFSRPHDVAISPAGDYLYVGEIGPNKIWKFEIDQDVLTGNVTKWMHHCC